MMLQQHETSCEQDEKDCDTAAAGEMKRTPAKNCSSSDQTVAGDSAKDGDGGNDVP